MSGTDLCRTIKRDPLLADIPVIFVTSHNEPEFEVACFALGAIDYVQKPVHAPVLLARVGTHIRLKQLSDELRRIGRVDVVTEVANRRVFDETLMEEWTRSLRTCRPLSLALVDIDHFKSFNDHYGHQAGDACLRAFADVLRSVAGRASDLVARYGGEEFALLLPDTEVTGAQVVADHLLESLHETAIPHENSPLGGGKVSASIGVSTFQPSAGSSCNINSAAPARAPEASDLVAAADRALYDAKRGGRRQSCTHFFDASREPAVQFLSGVRSSPNWGYARSSRSSEPLARRRT
jgi:diguanylate cyclase (GGDEF)-like protein